MVLRVLKPSNGDRAQHSPLPRPETVVKRPADVVYGLARPRIRTSSPKPDRPKWKLPVQPAIGGKGSVTGDEGDSTSLCSQHHGPPEQLVPTDDVKYDPVVIDSIRFYAGQRYCAVVKVDQPVLVPRQLTATSKPTLRSMS
ncbi:hypothetical protein PQX77_015805 [Marasmius sp. AFHP31]|nr:hypothetical protein PQX77_015805 [Marasmius sp. AFHP31]